MARAICGPCRIRSTRSARDYEVVRDAEGLRRGDKIILPGVGHFGQLMRSLDELGVRGA